MATIKQNLNKGREYNKKLVLWAKFLNMMTNYNSEIDNYISETILKDNLLLYNEKKDTNIFKLIKKVMLYSTANND